MANDLNKIAETFGDNFKKSIVNSVLNELESKIEEVKKVISDVYDKNLTNLVTDRNSRTRPEDYKDEFMQRLNNFTFIKSTDGNIKFITPDQDSFDFSGRLRVIETILEGLAGIYVEVDENQYKAIFGKQKIPTNPLDSSATSKDKIFLLNYNPFVRTKEKELKTKFVRYPFSNTPPIDIFDDVDRYVTNHLSGWVDLGIKASKKDFKNVPQGKVTFH